MRTLACRVERKTWPLSELFVNFSSCAACVGKCAKHICTATVDKTADLSLRFALDHSVGYVRRNCDVFGYHALISPLVPVDVGDVCGSG